MESGERPRQGDGGPGAEPHLPEARGVVWAVRSFSAPRCPRADIPGAPRPERRAGSRRRALAPLESRGPRHARAGARSERALGVRRGGAGVAEGDRGCFPNPSKAAP